MTKLIRTEIRNHSRFPIEIVWENAKDLEHVAYLHGKTNQSFQLMHVESVEGSQHEYSLLVYRCVRKLGPLRFNSFGFRKIVSEHNIYQLEYTPLLGITTALNSLLFRSQDATHPTLMLDEVVMKVPWFFAPLETYLKKAMHEHANIQCSEDEPFRARRKVLQERGVRLPFSIFNESEWKSLTALFQVRLDQFANRPQGTA